MTTPATVLVRGAHVHRLEAGEAPARALALVGDRIAGLGERPADLDGLIGPDTVVVDLPDRCVLPGLVDSHTHQLEASQDLGAVDIGSARTIDAAVAALGAAASGAGDGWVVSHRSWQEANLAEGRLPTTAELDGASATRPVAVRRGSRLAVLNTAGIEQAVAAGFGEDVRRTGEVRGLEEVRALLDRGAPTSPEDELARAAALHASRGLVACRDAGLSLDELDVYRRLAAAGRLPVRTEVMVAVPRQLDHAAKMAHVTDLGPPPGRLGSHLGATAVKLFVDGHIADAAIRAGSGGNQAAPGDLFLSAAELAEVAGAAVARGWGVGVHVAGDRALDVALDAFDVVLRDHPEAGDGRLVLEHALLADEDQMARAARLGVGVTVQHPLLDLYGAQMVQEWGDALAARANPVRGWLASGALVAAGSDGHVAPFDPLRAIARMVTRRTIGAGVVGPDEAIDLETAIRLYSTASHWVMRFADAPAGLVPGALADLVVLDGCIADASPEELSPLVTVVGGVATHDPAALWPGEAA